MGSGVDARKKNKKMYRWAWRFMIIEVSDKDLQQKAFFMCVH